MLPSQRCEDGVRLNRSARCSVNTSSNPDDCILRYINTYLYLCICFFVLDRNIHTNVTGVICLQITSIIVATLLYI